MTNEKELREEFYKEFPESMFHCYRCECGGPTDMPEHIADFWLSKLHSHTKEVVEKFPVTFTKKVHKLNGEIEYENYINKDDLLASLEDNKK